MVTPLDSWVSWRPLGAEQARGILSSLSGQERLFSDGSAPSSARWAILRFYERHLLLEFASSDGTELAYLLHGSDRPLLLDGSSAPIHDTNYLESLALTDEAITDYIRFFFFFVRGGTGAFVMVESPEEIDLDSTVESDESETRKRLHDLRSRVTPLKTRSTATAGWTADCTVAYGGALFNATLQVFSDGSVKMEDDDPIATLEGLSAPTYPSLAAISQTSEDQGASAVAAGDEPAGPGPTEPQRSNGDADAESGPAGPQVFICYRRDDMPDTARRLAQSLRDRLGEQQVFFDVDSLRRGVDVWTTTVEDSIRRSDAFLAVIGHRWLEGLRRLDGPQDPVRREIETAVQAGVKVIPIPVYGARLPDPGQLPESIASMVETQAVEINERHYDDDVEELTDAIERNFELKSFGQDSRPASERPRSREDRGRVAHAAITLLKEGFTLVEPERGEALMERAIEVFDDVIARRHEASNPLDREQVAKAAGYKAYILHRLDRHEQALRAYDEQVFLFGAESSPVMKRHVGRALVNKGILLAEMPGRQYDALAAYNQAISSLADAFEPALRELVAEALFNKAIVLDRRLEFRADQLAVYDELISRFGEVSEPEVRPYVASALVAKGQILALMDRAEEGRAIYEQVISQFADAPEPAVRDEVTRAIALLGKAE